MPATATPQPPIQPDPRAERLGAPRERGAAVGHRVVELAVGEGDEQHRDERDDERDGRLRSDREDDEAEGRDEGVDGRGGGEADDGGAPQAERAGGEPFAFGVVPARSDRGCSHRAKLWPAPRAVKRHRSGRIGRTSTAGRTMRTGSAPADMSHARPRRARSTARAPREPGQQPQFRAARRVDDQVVVGRGLGQHAPVPLPVVGLADEDDAPVGGDAGSAAYSSTWRPGCRARPTRRGRRAPAGDRRATKPVSRRRPATTAAGRGAGGAAPAARAATCTATPVEPPAPGRGSPGRSADGSPPAATWSARDDVGSTSAAREQVGEPRRSAPVSRWAAATTSTPASPAPRKTRSRRSTSSCAWSCGRRAASGVEIVDDARPCPAAGGRSMQGRHGIPRPSGVRRHAHDRARRLRRDDGEHGGLARARPAEHEQPAIGRAARPTARLPLPLRLVRQAEDARVARPARPDGELVERDARGQRGQPRARGARCPSAARRCRRRRRASDSAMRTRCGARVAGATEERDPPPFAAAGQRGRVVGADARRGCRRDRSPAG